MGAVLYYFASASFVTGGVVKRKRKTERGKERSLKFCIESFGKAVRRVSELAVRRVDFCDFFAGFG